MGKPREFQVELDEDFYILNDSYCWVLKNRKRGDGADTFFPTLKLLLKNWMDDSLKTCEGAESILKKLDAVEKRIDELKELKR
jgi:hypothetical protein